MAIALRPGAKTDSPRTANPRLLWLAFEFQIGRISAADRAGGGIGCASIGCVCRPFSGGSYAKAGIKLCPFSRSFRRRGPMALDCGRPARPSAFARIAAVFMGWKNRGRAQGGRFRKVHSLPRGDCRLWAACGLSRLCCPNHQERPHFVPWAWDGQGHSALRARGFGARPRPCLSSWWQGWARPAGGTKIVPMTCVFSGRWLRAFARLCDEACVPLPRHRDTATPRPARTSHWQERNSPCLVRRDREFNRLTALPSAPCRRQRSYQNPTRYLCVTFAGL